ncbi:hypothetical protein C0992_004309 [Termitomyces sp. T32_za158]|nr:hypothetical protein C0992_004309 [Termitomyces sp. T32_za158]
MFVSRTVAAEVCMEAKVNMAGYHALKVLDKSGDLRFELGDLIEELIKTFATTRSICYQTSTEPLGLLFSDHPSSNPTARLVMLVIFFNAIELNTCPRTIHSKLEARNLTPIMRKDVFNVLLNPFISDPHPIIDYAILEMGHPEEERKGMSTQEGNLLGHLEFRYEFVKDIVKEAVLKYHLTLGDLPPSDDILTCRKFRAKLSQDHTCDVLNSSSHALSETDRVTSDAEHCAQLVEPLRKGNSQDMESDNSEGNTDLVCPGRRLSPIDLDKAAVDTVPVGHWIKQTFGARSRLTAIFMTHAVVNNSNNVDNFLPGSGGIIRLHSSSERVPITLKHFKMLARVGKTPNHHLYTEIFKGCEFYLNEEDYIQDRGTSNRPVKMEASSESLPSSSTRTRLEAFPLSSDIGGRKRPRRTATTIKSYAIPDSSDESIFDDDDTDMKPRIQESNLQKWIFHLGELLKEEKRKATQRTEAEAQCT